MAFLIYDPFVAEDVRQHFERQWPECPYEVVHGDTIVSPLPNDEHQDLVLGLAAALYEVVQAADRGVVRTGVNLTDRDAGWNHHYRNPDVVVFLRTNPAVNHGTHWQGGPDLAVEIISPGEEPHAKLAFYESIATREVLIVHRAPWSLELFRLALSGDAMARSGTVAAPGEPPLASAVGVTFALGAGGARPTVLVHDPASGRVWRA